MKTLSKKKIKWGKPRPYRTSKQLLIVAAVCDAVLCSDGICNVVIPCKGTNFGKKIVKFFVARVDAADFASEASLITEADWTTRMAISCTGVTKVDRIVAVGDVHDGTKPPEETTTEEAPYGGDERTSTKQTVTFSIKRWDAALVTSINTLRCFEGLKMWYLTETGWLFGGVGGFDQVSSVWGMIQHPGTIGTRLKSDNTMSWIQEDQSVPVFTPFLATKVNP